MDLRPLDLDDFFLLRFPSDTQISPDGKTVAFVLTTSDRDADEYRSSIWLVDGGAPRQVTRGKKDRSPRWSLDGSMLAFIRPDDADKAQVWTIPTGGGEARRLTSAPEGVADFAWSPDGRRIAFTAFSAAAGEAEKDEPDRDARKPIEIKRGIFKADGTGYLKGRRRHLHVVSVDGGDPAALTEGDFDVASPCWAPDARQIAFVSAMHDDRDLDRVSHVFVVGAGGGELRQITDWKGTAAAPTWAPSGEIIVFAGKSTPRSDRHTRLFKVDASGGAPAEPTEIAPDLDRNLMVGAPGYPGAPPQITADGATVVFCARDGGCTHTYTVPLEGGSAEKVIGGSDRTVAGVSLSVRSRKVAFLSAAPLIPGDVYLASLDGSSEVRLTHLNDEAIASLDVPLPQRRLFSAPDGTEIEGWFLPAGGDEQDPRPLLLDVHGGPHNAHGPAFPATYLYRLLLSARGWNILYINSRGSDGYGQDFFGALTGGWGENDLGDFMSAVDALVDEGSADPDRLAVTGYSYGGFMTNWIITQTDRFAAAVSGGCIANLMSQYGASDFGAFLSWEIGGDAYETRQRYLDLSPISHVERVTTPVLILHGASDDRCPVGEAEQWFTALRRQRKTVEMVLYPGASHLFILQGHPSHRLDYSRRLVDWVTHHASGKGPEEDRPG